MIAQIAPNTRTLHKSAIPGEILPNFRRAQRPTRRSAVPYTTSPTITPNINGRKSAISPVGSRLAARGLSKKRVRRPNGRATRRSFISTGVLWARSS